MKFETAPENGITHDKGLVPQGEYDFEVVRAEEQVSKKNNPMIKLTLKVNVQDEHYWLLDYLSDKNPRKIKSFMLCIGLENNYSSGELSEEDCLGQIGRVKIVHEYSDSYGINSLVSQYLIKGDENEK